MKTFFTFLAAVTAAAVFACASELKDGAFITGYSVPYVAAVNGHSAVSSIETGDIESSNHPVSHMLTFHRNVVRTNHPFSLTLDCVNYRYQYGIAAGYGVFSLEYYYDYTRIGPDPYREPYLVLSVDYSLDGSTWVNSAVKQVQRADLNILKSILFRNITLPTTLPEGSTVYLRLTVSPLGELYHKRSSYVSDTFEHLVSFGHTRCIEEDGSNYLFGSGDNTHASFSHIVKIVITGNRRPGRN